MTLIEVLDKLQRLKIYKRLFYLLQIIQQVTKWIPEQFDPYIMEINSKKALLISYVDLFFMGISPAGIVLFCLIVTITTYLISSPMMSFLRLVVNLLYFYDDTEKKMKRVALDYVKKLPYIKSFVKKERAKFEQAYINVQKKANKERKSIVAIPMEKNDAATVLELLDERLKRIDPIWKEGKCSGCVYSYSDKLASLCTQIYSRTMFTNPLHSAVFDEIQHMENEVVEMVAKMFNGDSNTCGSVTSGGTVSILLACKTYRDIAYSKGIKNPNIVASASVHASFIKAGDYFNIEVRSVPIDEKTGRCNMKDFKSRVNSNTCLVVASAPCYPHGIIDQVKEISDIALKKSIGCHVDCCLGGFIIPFMESAGFPIDIVDFRLPGVTSISADTHKYGLTPKGSSIILYRNSYYKSFQIHICEDWLGGIYGTPTIEGSRCGSTIAVTWGVLIYTGLNSYIHKTKKICETFNKILEGIKKIEQLTIIGDPKVHTIAFKANSFETIKLLSVLGEKGYDLGFLQNPGAIHLSVTASHTKKGFVEKFLNDVKASIADILTNPSIKAIGSAALYGKAEAIFDRRLVKETLTDYINATTKLYL